MIIGPLHHYHAQNILWPTTNHHYGSYQPRGFQFEGHSLHIYNSLNNSLRNRREFRATDRDGDYRSLTSVDHPRGTGAKTVFMSHDQFKFKLSGDVDSSMLNKLENWTTIDDRPLRSRGSFNASLKETVQRQITADPRTPSPLLICELGKTPARFARSASTLGLGARESAVLDRSPPQQPRGTNSKPIADGATISTQGSYTDAADFIKQNIDILTSKMDYQTFGQKRRAPSPLAKESSARGRPGAREMLRRGDGASRPSPMPRLTVPRNVPFVGRSPSSYMLPPLTVTSTTSMTRSFYRRSSRGFSPEAMAPVDGICNSPLNTPISLIQSPRSAISRAPNQHQLSESQPLFFSWKLAELPKDNVPRIQDVYMCECCPKKPKKFKTARQLSIHVAEKKFECFFCGNRFKNKNEAERHQRSMHVRRHSWSCSVLHLAGYSKAFHESINCPGAADVCGYCGEEFLRSGGTGLTRHLTERDWSDRLRHLLEVHKFRECNLSKKFFRADHFRQHLKYSHAGTSGSWTSMLETACLMEEEPSQTR